MYPKFKDIVAYRQANLLMQPAFIRVIDNIRKELNLSEWEGTYEEIKDPYPGYLLLLKKQDYCLKFNLWDICFQVCFVKDDRRDNEPVEVDTNLFDESGNLDWHNLENKTQKIVKDIFQKLPLTNEQ
jgi:hypothetical protein